MAGQPGGEAGEVGDNDADVGAPEGEEDAGMVGRLPGGLGSLAVAEEGVEEAAGQHAYQRSGDHQFQHAVHKNIL